MTYEGQRLHVRLADPQRWRRLPVRSFDRWLPDRRAECVAVELDARGLPRPAITKPEYHRGRKPGNYGKRYEPTPPTPEEVEVLIAGCSRGAITGRRNRALIRLLHRSGLRISEALALTHSDLHPEKGLILVKHGKGDKLRWAAMDREAWAFVTPWLEEHLERFGRQVTVFCVATGPTRGRALNATYVRSLLARLASEAGIEHRCAPHQLRHGLSTSLAREGFSLFQIQAALGHSNPATTAVYLRSLDPMEQLSGLLDRTVLS